MATGGSGDVLTGVILALLAQGYPTEEAAKIGTYIPRIGRRCRPEEARDDRNDRQRYHHLSADGMATCKRIKVKNLQFFQ